SMSKECPIRRPLLPQPGDSLRRQITDHRSELAAQFAAVFLVFVLAVFEWLRYWFSLPPMPWFITTAFGVCAAIGIRKAVREWRQIQQLKLGLQGEQAVGQMLEELRAKGYQVFHDLEEDGYNIDHILIGPGGVFAIETKTRMKAKRGKVLYDGACILIDGQTPDRDPLRQAKAVARRVRDILKEQTGREVWVQPVVLFPGWYVEITVKAPEVYVANDKWFMQSFEREHRAMALSPADVVVLSAGMARYLGRDAVQVG
ncbi:MAG: nuclease-related domain-containing protein, partial [Bacillota bacterium]